MNDNELEDAIAEFMGAFEEVFQQDWEWTKSRFISTGSQTLLDFYIKPNATFLEPAVADEEENWGARAVLLDKYRRLRGVLDQRGLQPKPPFPHRVKKQETN